MKKMNADLMLLMVAIIWGTGFIAVEYAIDANMSAMLILAIRFSVAAIVLLAIVVKDINKITKKEWIQGSIAGVFLFLGFYLQTVGQGLTTVSNTAFITATNVIMVPFVVWFFTKEKPALKIVFLACLTFTGVAVLTVSVEEGLTLNLGDVYILLCAIAFACHIAYLGIAAKGNDARIITFIQMGVATILSVAGLVAFDLDTLSSVDFGRGLPAVIFVGLFSTCLCFFMQTSAQKRTSAAKAGIIMSMEGLFGTLFSIILGIEPLTAKIGIGGILILSAVILTELPLKKTIVQKANQ